MKISYLLQLGNIDDNFVLLNNTTSEIKNTEQRECFYLHTLMGDLTLVVGLKNKEIFGFNGHLFSVLKLECKESFEWCKEDCGSLCCGMLDFQFIDDNFLCNVNPDMAFIIGEINLPTFMDGQVIAQTEFNVDGDNMCCIGFPKSITIDKTKNIIMFGKITDSCMVVRVCKNMYVGLDEKNISCIIIT